jgi:hypothetical protein
MKAGRGRGEKRGRKGCGNAGAVESVESQRQASHSFHEPLGNLAPRRRDSHIPTALAKRSGKVENQKQVSHFPIPLRDDDYGSRLAETSRRPSAATAALRAASRVIVIDREK